MSKPKSIGVLGGTFDPIHFGHLRAALEISEQFKLDQIRLIPCKQPPHRGAPIANAEHRLQMVKLAVQQTKFIVDDQEMQREGPSYSIDTLMSLRRTFPYASLCMIVGVDAFLSLPSWYQWEKLIQLVNIVVMYRSGWQLPNRGIMYDFLIKYALGLEEKIVDFRNGKIVAQSITILDIHASKIREMVGLGQSPRFLLPEKTIEYIQNNQLYSYNSDHFPTQQEVAHI